MFQHSCNEKNLFSLFDAEYRLAKSEKILLVLARGVLLVSILRGINCIHVAETNWCAIGK